MARKLAHYSDLKFLHKPTKKVWTCNGASGIINEIKDTTLPMWLTENSEDWVELTNPNATQYNPYEEKC